MRQVSRRDIIVLGAGAAALSLWPNGAFADAKEAAAEIAKFTGGKTAEKGKIAIELPEIAENGNTVPLMVTVNSPMRDDDYVSDVLVVSEGNPRPGVAHFHLSPMSGKAVASTRIRVAGTQNIVVVAKTRAGAFFTDAQLVKVTIGGWGGWGGWGIKESTMAGKARLKVPKEAKKGEVIEIKTLIAHIMESGQRKD